MSSLWPWGFSYLSVFSSVKREWSHDTDLRQLETARAYKGVLRAMLPHDKHYLLAVVFLTKGNKIICVIKTLERK
jgi:hypothetical protein